VLAIAGVAEGLGDGVGLGLGDGVGLGLGDGVGLGLGDGVGLGLGDGVGLGLGDGVAVPLWWLLRSVWMAAWSVATVLRSVPVTPESLTIWTRSVYTLVAAA
jgi:hypothetical protein